MAFHWLSFESSTTKIYSRFLFLINFCDCNRATLHINRVVMFKVDLALIPATVEHMQHQYNVMISKAIKYRQSIKYHCKVSVLHQPLHMLAKCQLVRHQCYWVAKMIWIKRCRETTCLGIRGWTAYRRAHSIVMDTQANLAVINRHQTMDQTVHKFHRHRVAQHHWVQQRHLPVITVCRLLQINKSIHKFHPRRIIISTQMAIQIRMQTIMLIIMLALPHKPLHRHIKCLAVVVVTCRTLQPLNSMHCNSRQVIIVHRWCSIVIHIRITWPDMHKNPIGRRGIIHKRRQPALIIISMAKCSINRIVSIWIRD